MKLCQVAVLKRQYLLIVLWPYIYSISYSYGLIQYLNFLSYKLKRGSRQFGQWGPGHLFYSHQRGPYGPHLISNWTLAGSNCYTNEVHTRISNGTYSRIDFQRRWGRSGGPDLHSGSIHVAPYKRNCKSCDCGIS